MRLPILAALIPLALAAQSFPDGATLLKRSNEALNSYPSYDVKESMSADAGVNMTMHMQAVKPGKMRMEMNTMGMEFSIVMNGKDGWMYMPAMKKYMRIPSEADLSEFNTMAATIADPVGAKVVRSESLTIDGLPHDCWVIESADKLTTYWVDKILDLQLQVMRTQAAPGAAALHVKMTMRDIHLSPSLPDSLFAFTPPADAKEVDEIFPGMKSMMKAGPPKEVAAPNPPEAPKSKSPHPSIAEYRRPRCPYDPNASAR